MKYLTSFVTLVLSAAVCKAQFVALGNTNLTERNVIPIAVDYTPTLDDCPLKYYNYGGQYLASSAALNFNFHHKFSHFVVLTKSEGDFCNGILISDEWILTTEECKDALFVKVGFTRGGSLMNFTAHSVNGYKEKGALALLRTESLNFDRSVVSACLADSHLAEEYFLNINETISSERSNGTFPKVFQDQLTFEKKSVPFVALDVQDFGSYIRWIEETTKLNFTPKVCAKRFYQFRRHEKYTARDDLENHEHEQIIYLNALFQKASHREGSFRAFIYNEEKYVCAGLLINDRSLLTVASCNVMPGFKVQFEKVPEKLEVVKTVNHPEFNATTLENDIAVLEIDKSPEFTEDLYPVCIPRETIEELNDRHQQTGKIQVNCDYWECYNETLAENENVVLIISKTLEEDKCKKYYEEDVVDIKVDYKKQFCSGNDERLVPETCLNDIGGPIGRQIFNNRRYFNFVFGLNSFGRDCGCNHPTLATRLSAYREWIAEATGLGTSKAEPKNENLKDQAQLCVSQNLNQTETVLVHCKGVFINGTFFTLKSCLENSTDVNGFGTIDGVEANISIPLDCVWNETRQVPFSSVVSINGTLKNFFTIFSKDCQEKYNFTLSEGEFCIESEHEVDQIEVPVGTAVWYPGKVMYHDVRGILFGLIRTSKMLKGERMVAVASVVHSNIF